MKEDDFVDDKGTIAVLGCGYNFPVVNMAQY
jgi:hypothetical protein